MFVIQKMSPTTITDPMQQKIMTFMPVMFTFFFLFFPSGLVLYWLVSNIVTLIQQTLIYKALEKKAYTPSKFELMNKEAAKRSPFCFSLITMTLFQSCSGNTL